MISMNIKNLNIVMRDGILNLSPVFDDRNLKEINNLWEIEDVKINSWWPGPGLTKKWSKHLVKGHQNLFDPW